MSALRLSLYPRVENYTKALEIYQDPTRQAPHCVQLRQGAYNYTVVKRTSGTIEFFREHVWLVRYHPEGAVESNDQVTNINTVTIQNHLLPADMQRTPVINQRKQRPFAEIRKDLESKSAVRKAYDESTGTWTESFAGGIDAAMIATAKLQLDYDPATETFTWKSSGAPAGTVNVRGYRQMAICGKKVYAHLLAAAWDRPPTESIVSPPNKGGESAPPEAALVEPPPVPKKRWPSTPEEAAAWAEEDFKRQMENEDFRNQKVVVTPDLSHTRVVGWGEALPSAAPKTADEGFDFSDWIEE